MLDRRGSAAFAGVSAPLGMLATLMGLLGAVSAGADGFYVEVEPGLAMLDDSDLTVRSDYFLTGGEAKGDLESEPTFSIGGAVGYRWHGLRIEVDASWRKVDFDDVTLRAPELPGGGGKIGDDGDLQVVLGLVNAFYGIRFGRFEPFIGAGLGFADIDLEGDYGANVLEVDQNSTEFAWSISGGVSFAVHEHVDVSLGYRYLGMTDPDFATAPYRRPNPSPPPPEIMINGTAEIEVVLHELFAGLRYNF